ncbi:MAG: hypothetical protein JJU02_03525 [Cryomorphaceae bacterium]|nr:hypothetical protein [Cryomorphaceae bacterium]
MRNQKSTDKEDFGRKGLFGADSIAVLESSRAGHSSITQQSGLYSQSLLKN